MFGSMFQGGYSHWLQKKTGAPIITLNTVDEAQRFLNKYHTFVLGLFENFEVFQIRSQRNH